MSNIYCKRCKTPMKTGIALANTLAYNYAKTRGATCSFTAPPKMIQVWKCPTCGQSVAKNNKDLIEG